MLDRYTVGDSYFEAEDQGAFVEWINSFDLSMVVGMEIDKLTDATFDPLPYCKSYHGNSDMRNSYICLKSRYDYITPGEPRGSNCSECPLSESNSGCSSYSIINPMITDYWALAELRRNESSPLYRKRAITTIKGRRDWIIGKATKLGIMV